LGQNKIDKNGGSGRCRCSRQGSTPCLLEHGLAALNPYTEEVPSMQGQRQLPPIWVLNLRRSVERRNYITSHLASLGLPFELIEAVDGRALSRRDLDTLYSPRESVRLIGRELTLGEIGCYLSHLKLYRKQIDEGWDEVVIFEDDAVVDPALFEVLSQRRSLPADWDLVLFNDVRAPVSFWGSRPFGRFRCVKFASTAWCTVGYILRRSGAQKLLAHGYPVRVQLDGLTGGSIRTGVRLYGIDPHCVRQLSEDASNSTMPEAYPLHERWPTRDELPGVLWNLHRMKWGMIHFYRRANPFSMV
jgi:glycosyl transferase family 25